MHSVQKDKIFINSESWLKILICKKVKYSLTVIVVEYLDQVLFAADWVIVKNEEIMSGLFMQHFYNDLF